MQQIKNYTPIETEVKRLQQPETEEITMSDKTADQDNNEEVMSEVKIPDTGIDEGEKPANKTSVLLLVGIGALLLIQLFLLYSIFLKKSFSLSGFSFGKKAEPTPAPTIMPTTAPLFPSPSPTLMPTATPTLEQSPDALESELNLLQQEFGTTSSGIETPPDIEVDF